jgi:hypothetical protein
VPSLPNFANFLDVNNYTTRLTRAHGAFDSYEDIEPECQQRCLWPEALWDYWPHFRRGTYKQATYVINLTLQLLQIHCVSQIVVTIIQSLGVHFHNTGDDLGFLPRYWINLTTLDHVFGVVGAAELRSYARYLYWWFRSWIYGPTALFTWHLPAFFVKRVWFRVKWAAPLPLKLLETGVDFNAKEVYGEATASVREMFEGEVPWAMRGTWK